MRGDLFNSDFRIMLQSWDSYAYENGLGSGTIRSVAPCLGQLLVQSRGLILCDGSISTELDSPSPHSSMPVPRIWSVRSAGARIPG